jgi:4'-phosphopantetheinyl transferase
VRKPPDTAGVLRSTGDAQGDPAADTTPLVPGICQVWWALLADVGPQHDALLAPADLVRRARLARAADRHRLTAAAVTARVVLAAMVGERPTALAIDRTCPRCGGQHGKPRLTGTPDLHFSVSHSGSAVAVAVAWGQPVGVDVEGIGALRPAELDRVLLATLAPEERLQVLRQPVDRRILALTTYWTRKEAVLKATGQGLTAPMDELVVSPPTSPPRVLRWNGSSGRPGDMALHSLHPPPGFVASLAVVGGASTRVAERDAGGVVRRSVTAGSGRSVG